MNEKCILCVGENSKLWVDGDVDLLPKLLDHLRQEDGDGSEWRYPVPQIELRTYGSVTKGEFADSEKTPCVIWVNVVAYHKKLGLGCYDHEMLLGQDQVKALIPMLQHFSETGELPRED